MTNSKNASEPSTSLLIQLLKAVEVAHETEETCPGRHSTKSASDSLRLEAHDDVLVQCRRNRRVFSDILAKPSSCELPQIIDRGNFKQSAPVILSTKHSSDGLPGPSFELLGDCSQAR